MRTRYAANGGQSMIEAIVALGIIMTAVSAALTLVASAVRANKESESAFVAANLAREALEAARAVRDTNWLSDRAWDVGLFNAGNPSDCTAMPVFDPARQSVGFWTMDFSVNLISELKARVLRTTATGDALRPPGLLLQSSSAPSGAVPTGFSRLLTLKSVCRDKSKPATDNSVSVACACASGVETKIGIQAVADVQWAGRGGARHLLLEETFYNWR